MIIYKYTLAVGAQTVDMPEDAVVLQAHEQNGEIRVWVESEDPSVMAPRAFFVVGTGDEFDCPEDAEYIDTVHVQGFVWHVYEVP